MKHKFISGNKRKLYRGMSTFLTLSIITGSVILSQAESTEIAKAQEIKVQEVEINEAKETEAQEEVVQEVDTKETEAQEEVVQEIDNKETETQKEAVQEAENTEAKVEKAVEEQAAETQEVEITENKLNKINSMNYFSEKDGPVLSQKGVGTASYGFVMPVFNNGDSSWGEVASDLQVNVKVNDKWIDIDDVDNFAYDLNWGNWSDGGFNGYWFKVSETTEIQLASKSNSNVTLNYTLEFTNLSKTVIDSMTVTQGPDITAGVTGGAGFTYPTFNNDSSVIYSQVADDLKVYIWSDEKSEWIDIDNNAVSGWIYDKNFGQFTDGGGGYWFTVDKTTKVRLASKSSPEIYLDYVISYDDSARSTYNLSAETTTYTAGDTGAIGIPLPKIDGGYPRANELDNFVYEIKVNGAWKELGDSSVSGFSYQGNGYNSLSDKNQWGYWVDGIYGLWFQPIQEDMEFRIGYPTDGIKGDSIGNNYVYYNFIGNPNAERPDVSDLGNIKLGTTNDSAVDGWNLIWNDEFSGNKLNTNIWNYNTGYYINNDPSMWGWGNNELEYYTDSEKNTFVKDGSLNLVTYNEPKTFTEIDPNRVAPYSSGKITTKDKFTFKYGRIDFRAKLPSGTGLWPALWMLPNDDKYGAWAASGEIDVMEARGRLTGSTSGTIHYGGVWPANIYIGSDYSFKDGQTIDSDYHVYSAVWEDDNIKWYVDGNCFFKATKEQWYSLGDVNNDKAPFDQDFYIIMNLAVGGWFDGGLTPNESDIPATMQVDYVRVYKADGDEESPEVPDTNKDVAKGKTVTCSGIENDVFSAANLTDDNAGTRWASNFSDDAWFIVDLENVYKINEINFNWEESYGKKYEIMVSEDGINYTSVFKEENGNGGVENISINPINARYVKFKGVERALPYGYSLWDIKIIGK